VIVQDPKGFSFKQMSIDMEGAIGLQLSAKSVGLFEAFYSSMKPVTIVSKRVIVANEAKCARGETCFEFSMQLESESEHLHETYHGVYINIQYTLSLEVIMPMMKQNMKKSIEFIVEAPETKAIGVEPASIDIVPASVERVHKGAIPDFRVCGKLQNLNCDLRKPLVGELIVDRCADPGLSSIDLQLIRIETCGCSEGVAREATEIQSVQIASGDVCQGEQWVLPIHMFFPRLFTCPTMKSRNFKIEFEVNVVVKLANGMVIAENFPLQLYRQAEGAPAESSGRRSRR